MALSTGFITRLDYGAGAATTATVGKVISGEMRQLSNVDYDLSQGGSADPRYGMIEAAGNATFLPTVDTFLAYGIRSGTTSPSMTTLCFEGGNSTQAFQHKNANIQRLALECAVGQTLQATVEWIARTPAQIAVPSWNSVDAGETLQWYRGTTMTVDGGTSLALRDFRVEVTNGLVPETSLDAKSALSMRFPEEIRVGPDTIRGSFTAGVAPGSGRLAQAWADVPSVCGASIIMTNVAAKTLTITLGNLRVDRWSLAFVTPDQVSYYRCEYTGLPLQADTIAVTFPA